MPAQTAAAKPRKWMTMTEARVAVREMLELGESLGATGETLHDGVARALTATIKMQYDTSTREDFDAQMWAYKAKLTALAEVSGRGYPVPLYLRSFS